MTDAERADLLRRVRLVEPGRLYASEHQRILALAAECERLAADVAKLRAVADRVALRALLRECDDAIVALQDPMVGAYDGLLARLRAALGGDDDR